MTGFFVGGVADLVGRLSRCAWSSRNGAIFPRPMIGRGASFVWA